MILTFISSLSAKLHLANIVANMLPTCWERHQRTRRQQFYNMLATCWQQFCHQRTKFCHIPTSWHVEMLGSGNARAQQCCRASSNRNDGFDHVISDEIVVNNKTDDDASIFEQKRNDFSVMSHSCGIRLLPLLLLTIINRKMLLARPPRL